MVAKKKSLDTTNMLLQVFYGICGDPMLLISSIVVVWGLTYIVYDYVYPPKKIPGVFDIPGYPVVGNYFQLLNNPAKTCMNWLKKYDKSIFLIRLGNKRILVVNKFNDVNEIWGKSVVNSRPIQFTFHNIVSSTKGFTIGTTPFGPSYKMRKQFMSQFLNEKNINSSVGIIDGEINFTMKNILNNYQLNYQPSSNPYIRNVRNFDDIDLYRYLQYFTLRTSILLTYGIKLDCYNTDKELCATIIETESKIIQLRSPILNITDYFPFLRFFKTHQQSTMVRKHRDQYMEILLQKHQTLKGPGVFSNNLITKYLTENYKNLDSTEFQSICLTMISAGLDNTPLNLNHLFGQLTLHPEYQARAFDELLEAYDTSNLIEIWKELSHKVKSPFIVALIKETLRYFTVLPLSLPQVITKPLDYQGVTIPEGTTLFMNAFAANHDEDRFLQPFSFNPDRWLNHGQLKSKDVINQFSFGKGVRMCSGSILAFKEMYIIVCKMIILFKFKKPKDSRYSMGLDPFEMNTNPSGTSFEPRTTKVRLVPRVHYGSDDLFNYLRH